MVKKIIHFFDRFEDRVRGNLSKYPIIYAFIGGVTMVLFWRGVWHTGDILMAKGGIWAVIFYEPTTLVWTSIIMLATGLFVSFFIGDRIILSGLKHEKKIFEMTEAEVMKEEGFLKEMYSKILSIEAEIKEIKEKQK